jgi:hypothetical protein
MLCHHTEYHVTTTTNCAPPTQHIHCSKLNTLVLTTVSTVCRLDVGCVQDLNRQIVKSDTGSIRFPDIDFEIPALSQRGQLNTIEGVLARAIDGLSEQQPVRKVCCTTVSHTGWLIDHRSPSL